MGYFVLSSNVELNSFKIRKKGYYIHIEPFGSYLRPPRTNKKFLYYLETNGNLEYSINKYDYNEMHNIFNHLIKYLEMQLKESKEISLVKQLEPYRTIYNEIRSRKIIDLSTYVFNKDEFKIELNVEYIFIKENSNIEL